MHIPIKHIDTHVAVLCDELKFNRALLDSAFEGTSDIVATEGIVADNLKNLDDHGQRILCTVYSI